MRDAANRFRFLKSKNNGSGRRRGAETECTSGEEKKLERGNNNTKTVVHHLHWAHAIENEALSAFSCECWIPKRNQINECGSMHRPAEKNGTHAWKDGQRGKNNETRAVFISGWLKTNPFLWETRDLATKPTKKRGKNVIIIKVMENVFFASSASLENLERFKRFYSVAVEIKVIAIPSTKNWVISSHSCDGMWPALSVSERLLTSNEVPVPVAVAWVAFTITYI